MFHRLTRHWSLITSPLSDLTGGSLNVLRRFFVGGYVDLRGLVAPDIYLFSSSDAPREVFACCPPPPPLTQAWTTAGGEVADDDRTLQVGLGRQRWPRCEQNYRYAKLACSMKYCCCCLALQAELSLLAARASVDCGLFKAAARRAARPTSSYIVRCPGSMPSR